MSHLLLGVNSPVSAGQHPPQALSYLANPVCSDGANGSVETAQKPTFRQLPL